MSRASILAKFDQLVQDYVLQFKERPNGPTPAQFLADDSLASTEFVQRALGSYSGIVGYTAAGTLTLTAADIGKHIVVNNATTIVLPAAGSVAPGATLHILVSGVTDSVVTRAGTDVISRNDAQTVNSFPVKANTSISLRQGLGGTAWVVCGGDASSAFSPLFAASMLTNGYQKYPSGLIEQWGAVAVQDNGEQTVVLPTAFSSGILGLLASVPNSAQAGAAEFCIAGARKNGTSLSTIFVNANSGPTVSVQPIIYWRAWGY